MNLDEIFFRFSPGYPAEPPPQPGGGPGDTGGGGGLTIFLALAGLALVFVGAGLAFVSSGFERDAVARAAGGNTPVNAGARTRADLSAHNSPALVANPRNAANLVIADKIDGPRFSCALHVSFDGGVHWNQTPIPIPAGEEPKCYAPDVVFGADGELHLSFVTLKGRANAPNAVWLVRSPDGGQTLSDPIRARGPMKFQVRLAADPADPQRLYLTWVDTREVGPFGFAKAGNPIRASRSDDGGRTWSAPIRLNPYARARALAPTPVVGPKGELYVLYLDLGKDVLDYEGRHRGRGGAPYEGSWKLVMARSTDRGVTWDEAVVDDNVVPTERLIAFTPPFPSLAVDRRSRTLYAGFHDGRRGNADVYVWKLTPGSRRWGAPVKVNDTPRSDDTAQMLPRLSIAPDGRLDVLYYDRRGDRTGRTSEVSLQSSFDRGRRFVPRMRLSDLPFDTGIGYGSERGMAALGTRLGLVSTRERALGVWTDTRAGTPESGKQDLARGLAAFSPPEDLSATRKALMRIAAVLLALSGVGLIAYAAHRHRHDHDPPRRRPRGVRRSPPRARRRPGGFARGL